MGFSRRQILTAMAAAPIALTMGNIKSGDIKMGRDDLPRPGVAANGSRMLGAAVRPDQLKTSGPLLDAIRGCDLLVPEYHGQWSAVEWRRGNPWFGNYDAIVDFATDHGQAIRGHSLIWEQMTPDWARAEMLAKKDWRTIERHFAHLLPRYSGQIGEWIVVNEMIDTENGHKDMRRTSFQRAFGNDYVARALETARTLDPKAKLMINEYALYHDNPVDEARRNALLKLVERLKAKGVPLDSVGVQGHLELAKGAVPQRRIEKFLSQLTDTGVEISFTEVDVLEDNLAAPLKERDARVADMVQSLMDVVRNQPAVTSIVTWGLNDKDSWLQERQEATQQAAQCTPTDCAGLNRGLPFDGNMQPKPMYLALQSAQYIRKI